MECKYIIVNLGGHVLGAIKETNKHTDFIIHNISAIISSMKHSEPMENLDYFFVMFLLILKFSFYSRIKKIWKENEPKTEYITV